MRIRFLGTGTSVGIPTIGCDCEVCRSTDPHNRRRRTSLYLEAGGRHIVVDTPPDFREQALDFRIARVDAVLFTHSHADHVFGFDDIRRYNTIQDCVIPAYGCSDTVRDLQRIFDYVQLERVPGLYRPRIEFRVAEEPYKLGGVAVTPLSVEHGPKPTLGYLFECAGRSLGYFPDCHRMSDDVVARLRGIDVMVLDALRYNPHPTHLALEESVALLGRIGAGRSFLVHLCHDLDHNRVQDILPDGLAVSYDGLTVEW
jgi:phosphoribosyl 1,2-cyclic phosphate phosphodiesterase